MRKTVLACCFFFTVQGVFAQTEKIVFDTKVHYDGRIGHTFYGTSKNPDAAYMETTSDEPNVFAYKGNNFVLGYDENRHIDYGNSFLIRNAKKMDVAFTRTMETKTIQNLLCRKYELKSSEEHASLYVWVCEDYKFSNIFMLDLMTGNDLHSACKGLIAKIEMAETGKPVKTVMEIASIENCSVSLAINPAKLKEIETSKKIYKTPEQPVDEVIEEPQPQK